MNYTLRQEKILNILLSKDDYYPGKKIANELNVSVKTIYRDIKTINQTKPIINYKKACGYAIDYNEYISNKDEILKTDYLNYSILNRRKIILIIALLKSPNSISYKFLSEEFYTTYNSIKNDFQYIKKNISELSNFSAELEIEINNCGINIKAKEQIIRASLCELLADNLFHDRIDTFISKVLDEKQDLSFRIVNKNNIKEIIKTISYVEKEYNFSLDNPYYSNLICYLIVMLERHQNSITHLDDNTKNHSKNDNIYSRITNSIINKMQNYLKDTSFSKEYDYIYNLISNSRPINNNNINYKENLSVHSQKIIELISKKLDIELDNDNSKEMICQHTELMLGRAKNNINIHNPILNKVIESYESLFLLVKITIIEYLNKIDFNIPNDDELAYLTVYFQGVIENRKNKINALIVCSTGLGISQLLKTRILNAGLRINIVDVISSRSLKEYNTLDLDLIISTIELENQIVPTIVVSDILNNKDIKNIEKFLENTEK